MVTNLIEKSRVSHKGTESDLVIVMLDPDLFIVMLVLWKHLVFSAFWQERIYQSFQAFRWSVKKTQRKIYIHFHVCDKPGNRGFAFMRSYQKNSGSEKDETRKDETAGVTTLRNAVILLQLFFFYSVVLVWKWFYWEFLDRCPWLSELVFPLFNPCGQTQMVAVKANFKFQLKFDVVTHEHYLLQVFEDHGYLFSKFTENCCGIHHHLHTCISVARN